MTVPITMRGPVESDLNFIRDSWKHGLRRFPEFRDVSNDRFFPWISPRLDRVLAAPTTAIVVACDGENQGQIYGYVITRPELNALIWVYTKQSLRGMGVARTMAHRCIDLSKPVRVAHRSLPVWIGSFSAHAEKHRIVFDPTVIE